MVLQGNKINLILVNESHLNQLMEWENNPENQKITQSYFEITPQNMLVFIAQNRSWEDYGQLRFIIQENQQKELIGTIDLYNCDRLNKSGEVGVLIASIHHRSNGYASEALSILIEFARNRLDLFILQCSIQRENKASIYLFESKGFKKLKSIERTDVEENSDMSSEIKFQLCLKK